MRPSLVQPREHVASVCLEVRQPLSYIVIASLRRDFVGNKKPRNPHTPQAAKQLWSWLRRLLPLSSSGHYHGTSASKLWWPLTSMLFVLPCRKLVFLPCRGYMPWTSHRPCLIPSEAEPHPGCRRKGRIFFSLHNMIIYVNLHLHVHTITWPRL